MMQILPFVGPSYMAQATAVDCERSVNLYVEALGSPNAKTRFVLLPAPGMTLFGTLPQGPVRGCFSQDGRSFWVGGPKLYELTDDGAAVELGSLAVDEFPATICSNGQGGHQLFITSGNEGYVYDLNSGVFSHELTGARMGAFLDGYFLALDATTSTLQLSALEDGTNWDPTDVAQRSTAGDKWVAMFVVNRQVWLIGSASSEVWFDSGDALFPLQPVDGAFFQQGTSAPFAAAVFDAALLFLATNPNGTGMVYEAAENGAPQPISTPAVSLAMGGYTTISDAVGWTYQEQGHQFYVLNFPTAMATWVYDRTTQTWHERPYWDAVNAQEQAYRPMCHTYTFGMHLVGDRSTGAIFTMDSSHATEVDGTGIRRLRQVPVYSGTNTRMVHTGIQIDLDPGLGLASGQGSDPQIALSWSNDGGHVWSNEHWMSSGRIGTYQTRVYANRLGVARGYARVYRIVMTDPVPWRISQAYLDVQAGLS